MTRPRKREFVYIGIAALLYFWWKKRQEKQAMLTQPGLDI